VVPKIWVRDFNGMAATNEELLRYREEAKNKSWHEPKKKFVKLYCD